MKRSEASNSTSDTTDAVPPHIPCAPSTNLSALHALLPPKKYAVSCGNSDYIHQLYTVIEHSPRLRQLKVIDHGLKTKMQVTQLTRIIREHPSLKDLTIQMHKMHLVQYKKLL